LKADLLNIIWLGLGGFIGSVSRYGTAILFKQFGSAAFPLSTFTVNVLGSLILGFLVESILNIRTIHPGFALFMTVGVCGGFTTFSTFTYENVMLIRDGQYILALIYALSSFFGAILAFIAGISIAKFTI
jgi:CrcB protein